MKANLNEVTKALDAPQPAIRFILLYGPDEAGSLALYKRLERAVGPQAERIDLSNAKLAEDPSRLSDEAAAYGLFGEARYIRLHPAGEEAVPALQALLDNEAAANPVVAIAGALRPTSALLKLALASPHALAFASYAPEGEKADKLAEMLAREMGLRVDRATARAIAKSANNDRSLMALEVEKLALYLDAGPDRPREAGMEEYGAINADSSEGAINILVDAIMGGAPAHVARETARLATDGITEIPLLRAVAKRVQQLAGLRAQVEAGARPRAVVEAQGKAIFWKDVDPLTRQLENWDPTMLNTAALRLLEAERAIKASGSAGAIVANAALLTLSRAAARRK